MYDISGQVKRTCIRMSGVLMKPASRSDSSLQKGTLSAASASHSAASASSPAQCSRQTGFGVLRDSPRPNDREI